MAESGMERCKEIAHVLRSKGLNQRLSKGLELSVVSHENMYQSVKDP